MTIGLGIHAMDQPNCSDERVTKLRPYAFSHCFDRNYMNDSLQTTVFVQYPPETIACACIYLAARVLQIPLPNRPSWFYLFNSTEEDIQKICLTLLCVYQTVKTPYHELEKKVDSCREVLQQEKLKARISQIEEASQFAANSPSSKAASPISGSPSTTEKHSSAQRSSTVPANSESNRVANGTNEKNGRIRRSHGSGYRQSRSRSRSGHRGGKYRRHSSTSSSSSAESSPNGRSKNAHSDLPKSYSQQNSNVKSSEKRHQNRKDKKQRHTSKHHRRREEGNAHKDRDYHSYRRDSSKKHKRKFSPDSPVKLSRVNGDERSPSSPSRKHRHRESHKKKRR